MFCICVLIIAAAAVYMVEAYIHTYYAIEYMHGAPLFFVLLAKYAAPVLFLLLCGYFVFRYREKRRESEKPAQDKPMNREEVYAEKINATVKTKAVFSDQADQMLYQVMRFGQKMAVAYSMTQDSKTSGEQAKCLTLLASAERIFYDRLDDALRSASMFDTTIPDMTSPIRRTSLPVWISRFIPSATTMQRIVFRSSLPSTRRQLSLATARILPISSAICSMQRCNSKARFCPRSCSKRQPPRGEQRTTGNSPGKSSFRTEGGIALCEYNRSRTLPILSITTITVIAVYPKAEKAKNPSRNPRCRSFLMQ